ncbi:MAG: hypothetical protein QM713_09630 [Arachnia sp.]
MASSPLAFVVIAGPQASGKSTLAKALADGLRADGERVALVELDQIAAMALPTLPGWDTAHRIFESVVGSWLGSDLTCVVAEGSGSADEVAGLRALAPAGVATLTVATTSTFDVAFSRAQADPTRGISRDHGFLSGVYERWSDELARINPDVVIDTGAVGLDQGVELVRTAIAAARAAERRDA